MSLAGWLKPAAGALLALLGASSCPSPGSPDLHGGVLATFEVRGERFSIFITNSRTIDQVIALSRGQSTAAIPSGRVIRGQASYNKPWHWHIDSQDVSMAEFTIELCDGLPSYVEDHLEDWISTVGYFCPWSAKLASVHDFR